MGLPGPDLTIYLDIPSEEAQKRKGYGKDHFEELGFQRKVFEAYDILLQEIDASKLVRIDATLPEEEITQIVLREIFSRWEQMRQNQPLAPLFEEDVIHIPSKIKSVTDLHTFEV